jgi:hypothetical protein
MLSPAFCASIYPDSKKKRKEKKEDQKEGIKAESLDDFSAE